MREMRQRRTVAVLGATGTVGQRFVSLLADHPWFRLTALTGSERSVGQRYSDAARWHIGAEIPAGARETVVQPTRAGLDAEIVFSALPAGEAAAVEEEFARAGHHVFSNARSHRMDADVPLLVPEVNPDHGKVLPLQRKDRRWSGSLVTNPNCSTIHLVLALAPLQLRFGIDRLVVTTMQALSGAGYPGVASLDALDNVVPFIDGEEEKMAAESRKILGTFDGRSFHDAELTLSAHCNRVAVRDGHLETVSLRLRREATAEEIVDALASFRGEPQERGLPTAPRCPVIVRTEPDRPQPILDREVENGMATVVGRVREDPVLGWKFVLLGHNTIRGAAGASVLNAELLVARGLV